MNIKFEKRMMIVISFRIKINQILNKKEVIAMFEHDAVSHMSQMDDFIPFKSFLLEKGSDSDNMKSATFNNLKINRFVDLKEFNFADLKVFFLEKGVVLNESPMLYKAKKVIHEPKERAVQKSNRSKFLPMNLVHLV